MQHGYLRLSRSAFYTGVATSNENTDCGANAIVDTPRGSAGVEKDRRNAYLERRRLCCPAPFPWQLGAAARLRPTIGNGRRPTYRDASASCFLRAQ